MSGAVLDEEIIEFSGPPTGGQPQRFARARLCSKILCQRHNHDLSPLDAEATKFRAALDRCRELAEVRQRLSPRKHWTLHEFDVKGPLVERWFVKTLINVEQTFPTEGAVWDEDADVPLPQAELVRIAYGHGQLADEAGLHGLMLDGNTAFERKIGIQTLCNQDNLVVGGVFLFHGFRFLLALYPIPQGHQFRTEGLDLPDGVGHVALGPRPSKLWFHVHMRPSSVIRFNWGTARNDPRGLHAYIGQRPARG